MSALPVETGESLLASGGGGGLSGASSVEDGVDADLAADRKALEEMKERREALVRTGSYGAGDNIMSFLDDEIEAMQVRLAEKTGSRSSKKRKSGVQ